MAELSTSALRRHTRANWVALRTLRQVPRLIGRTRADASIFEIRSVRVVLHDEALHFTRLVPCAKCGEEVSGTAVLSPADLDHRASAVICKDCAGTASPAAFPNGRPDVVEIDETAEHQSGSPGADLSPLGPASDALARSHDEMGRRLGLIGERLASETERSNGRHDALEAQLLEMRVGLASVVERIARDVERNETRLRELGAMRHQPDLSRIEEQLNDRLDRLAERAARAGAGDDRRLLAIEGTVGDIARRVTEFADTLGAELELRLRDGLTAATARVAVIEEYVAQIGHEMAQLGDLQAVLDAGLGQLRSRLGELTDVTSALALGQATLDARLQTLAGAQPATADCRRTLRRGEGPEEIGADMVVDGAPVIGGGDLEDKQLKAQLAMLEYMTDAALTASSETSGMEHLGDDVRALAERLSAHDDALTRLSRSVERLRRNAPNQPTAPRATSHRSPSS